MGTVEVDLVGYGYAIDTRNKWISQFSQGFQYVECAAERYQPFIV